MGYPVGPRRYRLRRQGDGTIIADDQVATGIALVLTPYAAPDSTYRLARSGALQVRGQKLVGVVAPARASGYEIDALPDGTIRFRKELEPQWRLAISRHGAVPRESFAIVDLHDGALLLVDLQGVRLLRVARAAPGASRAPAQPPHGGPIYHYADDFAP